MSTYFLRISSCISVVEGPAGFGPENQKGLNINTISNYNMDQFAEQSSKSNMLPVYEAKCNLIMIISINNFTLTVLQ